MSKITTTEYYCDFCGKEIQTETFTDCFGIKRTTILTGRINCKPFYDNFDMVRLGYYFCELCAEKMSHRLDVLKLNLPIVQEENKMLKIIPLPERNQYRCHFCDGKPVKYEMKCFDPVVSNKPIWVTCYNKCALFYNKDINSLTPEQMKIIGKLTNLIYDVRLAYLEGILDYMETTQQDKEKEFITALYNYISEFGQSSHTINEFCSKWKER